MHIKRYPPSDKSKIIKTDECNLKKCLKNDKVDLDITVEKGSLRESRVEIGFNIDDYQALHHRYIEVLNQRYEDLQLSSTAQVKELKTAISILYRIIKTDLKLDNDIISALDQLSEFGLIEIIGKIKDIDNLSEAELKTKVISKSHNPL
jgi:hypothetical protein